MGKHGTPQERFERLYIPEPNSGCWLWMGYVSPTGYGHFRVKMGERYQLAHRYAFEIYKHPLGNNFASHRCDVPSFVNPDHLFAGTQADNIRDCCAKGRRRTYSKRVPL